MGSDYRIILTGFSGTGKTAVGRRVARALGWRFVDADERIVETAGAPIERLFADEGDEGFRARERSVIAELCREPDLVLSTGGGAILDEGNRRAMLDSGLVVCLEARPETVYARLSGLREGDGAEAMLRPLLQGEGQDPMERIEALKRERQWAYALAHWTVSTDGLSVEQAAQEVLRAWRRTASVFEARSDAQVAAVVITESAAYPIVVGWGILEEQLGRRLLASGLRGRAYVICDANVSRYGRVVQRSLHDAGIEGHLFTFPAGEASKSLTAARLLYGWLAERRAERRDTIVAVGGGVTGDLAGFVAATYLRGMPLVQVPTSLVAMVDAAIGGKTAVDLQEAKNLVGAFHQPRLVLADVAALQTLPERALREGWAEALKHGLALDAGLVETYEARAEELLALDPEACTEVVGRNVAIKAGVVTEDERETTGLRALLNYGHTIGHAVEASAGYGRYLHSEAVAIGMTGAAMLGHRVGVTPHQVVQRQQELLQRFGLPSRFEGLTVPAIMEAMALDKKRSAGDQMWVLLEGMGRAALHGGVLVEKVEGVLADLAVS